MIGNPAATASWLTIAGLILAPAGIGLLILSPREMLRTIVPPVPSAADE